MQAQAAGGSIEQVARGVQALSTTPRKRKKLLSTALRYASHGHVTVASVRTCKALDREEHCPILGQQPRSFKGDAAPVLIYLKQHV